MIFREVGFDGAWHLEPERHGDDRGYFARTFCREQFTERELPTRFEQASVSFNHRRGTLRGLHFQAEPHAEAKLVRCGRGSLFDVMVDLRPGSPTLGRSYGALLSAENGHQLFIPEGFAHGFQTLADDTEVVYQITAPYVPESARGFRWDDPTFAIAWPEPVTVISPRDRELPFFAPGAPR